MSKKAKRQETKLVSLGTPASILNFVGSEVAWQCRSESDASDGVCYNRSRMEPGRIADGVNAFDKSQILPFYILIPFVIMALPAYTLGQASQPKTLRLSNEDKAAIISSILKKELRGKSTFDVDAPVLLSTENVAPVLSTGLTPSNLVILTADRIHEKASQQKGLKYLRFGLWAVKKRTVEISLTRQQGLTGSCIGLVYECKRRLGKWDCRGTEGFSIGT